MIARLHRWRLRRIKHPVRVQHLDPTNVIAVCLAPGCGWVVVIPSFDPQYAEDIPEPVLQHVFTRGRLP